MEDLIEKMINEIKADVGDATAIIGLSGGIDSSVATALAAEALGDKLTAVFVDHGFMRQGEPEAIQETFEKFQHQLRHGERSTTIHGETQRRRRT